AILAGGAAVLVLWTAIPLLRIAGGLESLAAAAAIGAAGVVLGVLIALMLQKAGSAGKGGVRGVADGFDGMAQTRPAGIWAVVLVVSLAAAAAGPHLYLVLGGAATATVAAQVIAVRSTDARRIPWL